MAAFGALLLICFLGIGIALFGLSISLLYYGIAGLVIGALARLVLPGRENIGLLGTSLIGIAGSMVGGVVSRALHAGQLMSLAIAVAVAAALLSALGFRARG